MKQKSKGRIAVKILLGIAALLVVIGALNYRAVRAVWGNWTVGHIDMDESTEWAGGTTYEKVPYAEESPSQYLDLYVPDMADGSTPQLYVIIHGGGFIANDSQSRQAQLMYRYFRDHGYACATINYRLAQEEPFPGAVCDCKAAIRFLRAHAEEYGYNAEKIAVFGESAGGYLAVMCAVTDDTQFMDLPFIGQETYGDVSAKVDVLVDYYGKVSQEGEDEEWAALGIPKIVYNIANSWISGDALQGYDDIHSYWFRKNVSEMTEEEKAYSDPSHYAMTNPDLSYLYSWIIHGDCDITVPYLESERFAEAMSEKWGADHVLYKLVPGMGHASDPLYSEEILGELDQYMREHLK